MTKIRVNTVIAATPADVWAGVEDISTHVEWMHDAESITFTSVQRSGVGTTFDCLTKVGPIKLTDKMEITSWEPEQEMGVRHVGPVEGAGAFQLKPVGDGHTQFIWEEELRFPWWLGGPIGEFFGAPVLKAIWRRNLENLKDRIEA